MLFGLPLHQYYNPSTSSGGREADRRAVPACGGPGVPPGSFVDGHCRSLAVAPGLPHLWSDPSRTTATGGPIALARGFPGTRGRPVAHPPRLEGGEPGGGPADRDRHREWPSGCRSKIKVLDGTVIRGSLVNVCGSVEKAPEAEVGKDFVDLALLDFSRFVQGGSILSFLLWFVFWIKILKAAFLSLAVVALAAIFTDRIALCAGVLPGALGRSFLFGLLCWVGAVFSIIVMAITLIGIPFAILAGLVFKLVWWGGIAAVSCAAGQQIGRNVFGRSLSYFSATLLGYLLFVIVYLIPFFGGLVMGILGLIGLGLMAITRLGTRIPGSGPPLFPGVPPPPAAPAAAATAPLA